MNLRLDKRPKQPEPLARKPLKDYEDESQLLQARPTDSSEVYELKQKVKTLMNKFSTARKERDVAMAEKETLQNQVMSLQQCLRQTVSGFSNTSSDFPICNQLSLKVAQFYKCDCLDAFFDVLCPQGLTLKGVVYFYYQAFTRISALIEERFEVCAASICSTGCLSSIDGPIANVLRKAFQLTYKQISKQIASHNMIDNLAIQICNKLSIGTHLEMVKQFIQRLTELVLCCKISDPPMSFDLSAIGKRIQFSSTETEAFDGFVRAKDQCWVVLPRVVRSQGQEVIVKSMVLHVDYDFGNQ